MGLRWTFALSCILVVVLAPGVARAAGTISGTVSSLAGGPVTGAVVTVAAPGQAPVTATTDARGRYSRPVDGSGPFGVGVHAKGFAGQSVAGVPAAGPPVDFALGPAEFTPLPVFAGGGAAAADAQSGVFYAIAGFAPDVYRSIDYGGSWQPVTMSWDDPGEGLRTTVQKERIATSSVPGEVAIASHTGVPGVSGTVSFSTDYGLTWRVVGGEGPASTGPGRRIYWAHASPGAPNVMLMVQARGDGGWDVFRADMSAASPAFVKEPADPFGAGSLIAVADSTAGSFGGRLSASGELSFAPLTASGPIAFGSPELSGLPAPPLSFALGGTKEPAAPPDAAVVAGGSGPFSAVMLTKPAGAASFTDASRSESTEVDCQLGGAPPRDALVAPSSGGSSGLAQVKFCLVQKNGGGQLTVTSGMAVSVFDARWGQPPPAGNYVAFGSGPGGGGLKSARLDENGLPYFESGKLADPGTDPSSGGLSVNGIASPDVRDAVYGPAGAGDVAAGLNDLVVASKDGGATMKELLPRGQASRAVAWWQGSGRTWLVFGHASCMRMLTAFVDWDGGATLAGPNVNGSSCTELGGAEGVGPPGEPYMVRALEPVPGTDMVFIGLSGGGINHLWRGTLRPGAGSEPPLLVDLVSLDPPAGTPFEPAALDYCPASADYEEGGVLFVAGGPPPDAGGPLLRVAGAAGPSPAVAAIGSVTGTADVRAACTNGVVYAGGSGGPGGGAFHKSTDGGRTFAPMSVGRAGPITAIGLNPANPNDVKVAIAGGTILHSDNGGTLNWTLLNDPTVDRPMNVHDIEYPPGGGPAVPGLARIAALAPPSVALVGTGSGVFQGSLAAASGVLALRATGGPLVGTELSNLALDSHPTVVTARTGAVTVVFRRSNGLYESSPAASGSWSLPALIPGTTAGDRFPVASADRAGRVHVAFARSGPGAGIYVLRRESAGAWSAPKRVSSTAGDTLPAITGSAGTTPRVDVAFLRTRGRARGVYHATGRRDRWRRAARLRGTSAADARPALGGPSLESGGDLLHLAFVRTGRRPGIFHAMRLESRWTAPRRLTKVRGDSQPSLAVTQTGQPQVAFRRTKGRRPRGLLVLTRARKWTLRHVPGTNSLDTEPALTTAGAGLVLVFARPAGSKPGIYRDRAGPSRRWLPRPERTSGDARDRNPDARAFAAGALTIVFERG